MGARAIVKVVGAKELRASLRKAGQDFGDLKQLHNRIASQVAAAARPPVRTGKLASTVRPSGTARLAVIRAGRARVPYAMPIHWGWPTRGIRPTPFITNAARATEPAWVRLYREEVEKIIAQVEGATEGR